MLERNGEGLLVEIIVLMGYILRSEGEDYGDDDVDDVLLERHRGLWWK